MKKLITLVLAMAMALSLVACGGDSSSNSGSNSGSNSQSNTQEGALKVALCMSGAVNDQGWNQSAYDGAKAACDKAINDYCKLIWSELDTSIDRIVKQVTSKAQYEIEANQ